MWRNTLNHYGWISIGLHWLVTVAVIALFALGLWMVELTYYDAWYQRAPDLHKSTGVLLFFVMLARLAWRLGNAQPRLSGAPWEQRAAHLVHGLLYLLLYALMVSGYLISTADGRAIDVFGLFGIPATLTGKQQEDIAGVVHEVLAYAVIALATLHALAALKHHFIDRDNTLKRMLSTRH
jgi:cytochrome b561